MVLPGSFDGLHRTMEAIATHVPMMPRTHIAGLFSGVVPGGEIGISMGNVHAVPVLDVATQLIVQDDVPHRL